MMQLSTLLEIATAVSSSATAFEDADSVVCYAPGAARPFVPPTPASVLAAARLVYEKPRATEHARKNALISAFESEPDGAGAAARL